MTVVFQDSIQGLTAASLRGFFEGWPKPPSPETHLAILGGATYVEVALTEEGRAVGFVYAISDGLLSAYIPLLEVLPAYRGQGIGTTLVQRLLGHVGDLYMVDLTCDSGLLPFYDRLGFTPHTAAIRRHMAGQSGRALGDVTDPGQ